jgi:hypothetical protein
MSNSFAILSDNVHCLFCLEEPGITNAKSFHYINLLDLLVRAIL